MALNDELLCLYRGVSKELEDLRLPTDGTLSLTFFIKVPKGYEDARIRNAGIRLVVVGQQTRGWAKELEGKLGPDPIQHLQDFYEGMLAHYRTGHFWRAVSQLQANLGDRVPADGFVWANMFPMSQNRGIPEPGLQETLASRKLLARELGILKPDAVVFFVGPDFQGALKTMFPSANTSVVPSLQSHS